MEKDFTKSKTYANLMAAFAGESEARNKYTFFASVAKNEGYEQISAIFQETADNEKEHAKLLYKMFSRIGTTSENLLAAATGEKFEWGTMYPNFEQVAKDEGYTEAAALFKELAEVEEKHEKRYLMLLAKVQNKKVFHANETTKWKCRNCGYNHEGKDAPDKCPACKHPQAYFELLAENY